MKQTLESLPLYRHKELYEWNEKYQEHKFFTDDDFAQEARLNKLKYRGEDDYMFRNGEFYDRVEDIEYRYEDRYSALKQDSILSKNLTVLENIRRASHSYSEYVLKSSVHGIEQKHVNFELLYSWFARKRRFILNFWMIGKIDVQNSFYSSEATQWLKFKDMLKEAFKDGHTNCCKYQDFINQQFS